MNRPKTESPGCHLVISKQVKASLLCHAGSHLHVWPDGSSQNERSWPEASCPQEGRNGSEERQPPEEN